MPTPISDANMVYGDVEIDPVVLLADAGVDVDFPAIMAFAAGGDSSQNNPALDDTVNAILENPYASTLTKPEAGTVEDFLGGHEQPRESASLATALPGDSVAEAAHRSNLTLPPVPSPNDLLGDPGEVPKLSMPTGGSLTDLLGNPKTVTPLTMPEHASLVDILGDPDKVKPLSAAADIP